MNNVQGAVTFMPVYSCWSGPVAFGGLIASILQVMNPGSVALWVAGGILGERNMGRECSNSRWLLLLAVINRRNEM